jgi:transcriptional regulator with XRE-family HTH domain
MESKKQAIADAIKSVIKEKGLGKSEFASLMGVQPSIITRWLSGTHNFTLETIISIEEKLGMEIIKPSLQPKVWNYKMTVFSKPTDYYA